MTTVESKAWAAEQAQERFETAINATHSWLVETVRTAAVADRRLADMILCRALGVTEVGRG